MARAPTDKMVKNKKPVVSKYHKIIFIKEIIFTILAVFSVFLLIYEYATSPPEATMKIFNRIEIVIALIFLFDFFLQMYFAKDKKAYFKRNWIYWRKQFSYR